MDLGEIRNAVEETVRRHAGASLEDVMLQAANILPAEASDFDRGIAAGFAAALLLGQNHDRGKLSAVYS